MKKLVSIILTALVIPTLGFAAKIEVGKPVPKIELKGDKGGTVDEKPWSTDSIKGKVITLFYVDPDKKTENDHVSAALKKEGFPTDKYGSISVINMDATGMPNFAINSALKDKQKEFPDTVFVKDMEKSFPKAWGIKDDDNNDVFSFDKEGNVIFAKEGKLSDADIQALIAAIKSKL